MPVLKPEYGPTLPGLLATRPLPVRVAAAAVALALVVGAIALVVSRPDETAIVVHEPVTFNLAYGPRWEPVRRPGALVALRHDDGRLYLDGYVVRELRLPAYRGAAGGLLPVFADGYRRKLGDRYEDFELVGEGRARINNGIGYELTFRAMTATGRRLYGRHLLLVDEEVPGVRRGVVIELESTPSAGTPNATAIGNHGALKTPLRSFRFGTERVGGTA